MERGGGLLGEVILGIAVYVFSCRPTMVSTGLADWVNRISLISRWSRQMSAST
jgi:hypothetical protein